MVDNSIIFMGNYKSGLVKNRFTSKKPLKLQWELKSTIPYLYLYNCYFFVNVNTNNLTTLQILIKFKMIKVFKSLKFLRIVRC